MRRHVAITQGATILWLVGYFWWYRWLGVTKSYRERLKKHNVNNNILNIFTVHKLFAVAILRYQPSWYYQITLLYSPLTRHLSFLGKLTPLFLSKLNVYSRVTVRPTYRLYTRQRLLIERQTSKHLSIIITKHTFYNKTPSLNQPLVVSRHVPRFIYYGML